MEHIGPIFQAIITGGAPAIITILLLLCGGFAFVAWKLFITSQQERQGLLDSFQTQIEGERRELIEVIEKYQHGQLSVVQAMNEIKILIATIGAKL